MVRGKGCSTRRFAYSYARDGDLLVPPVKVSAIIVTRGDVDLRPVLDSLPKEWERVVWNNGKPEISWSRTMGDGRISGSSTAASDLSVYGRYAAIEYASHDLIYVQDDDVIVSDPEAIVDAWREEYNRGFCSEGPPGCDYGGTDLCSKCFARRRWLVANMPQEFRHDGYTDSCLVGFGACFLRDLPARAFDRFGDSDAITGSVFDGLHPQFFNRTCDVVFTTLTPRVIVDVPKVDREFASDPDRMWKQPEHYGERVGMLELARKVRDA